MVMKYLTAFRDWLLSVSVRDASTAPHIPLSIDQVLTVIERELGHFFSLGFRPLTKDMIHNYIKEGRLSSSISRRYSSEQVFLLYLISLIKPALPIASIVDAASRSEDIVAFSRRFARTAEEDFRRIAQEISVVEKANRADPTRAAELALRFATLAAAYQGAARALIADSTAKREEPKEAM